jgi:hypothetical protein
MKNNDEILLDSKYFSVVKRRDSYGLTMKIVSVAVLPYTVDSYGLPTELGILFEHNEFRPGKAETLITGSIDSTDPDVLTTAKRELLEEGGFEAPGDDRWIFLGNLYTDKSMDRAYPTFAVNVTGLKQGEAKGDGSYMEQNSKLIMSDISKGITSDEMLTLAAYVRLMNYFYQKTQNK